MNTKTVKDHMDSRSNNDTVGCKGLYFEEQNLKIVLINLDNIFSFSTS